MILKTATNDYFDLTMKLNINWKDQYMDVVVSLHNKLTNKSDTKGFTAGNFSFAVEQYNRWLEFFFNEECI